MTHPAKPQGQSPLGDTLNPALILTADGGLRAPRGRFQTPPAGIALLQLAKELQKIGPLASRIPARPLVSTTIGYEQTSARALLRWAPPTSAWFIHPHATDSWCSSSTRPVQCAAYWRPVGRWPPPAG